MDDLVVRIPANFGEPRDPVTGKGAGETFELRCSCGHVVASGLWTEHSRAIGWAIECHADECQSSAMTLRRWK